jgi:ABC-type glycerol-3-phosphate transport system substrate-binding protein
LPDRDAGAISAAYGAERGAGDHAKRDAGRGDGSAGRAWYNCPGRGGTRIYELVEDAIQDAFLQKKSPKVALEEAASAANRLIAGRG